MISVAAAQAAILREASPLACETAALDCARGRTLRELIAAPRAQPPFAASAMDGYAVRSADTPGALRLVGEAGAGHALARALAPGQCARIFTGAPVPAGADAVAIQEEAERNGDVVQVPAVERGKHVRPAGVDFQAGEMLLAPGRTLDAGAIALAAAAGMAELCVTRQPRLAIVSGGDEIVAPGATPADDQIFDSVSYGIAALAAGWGALPHRGERPFADDEAAIAGQIAAILDAADLTVLIGGASVGDRDFARPAMRRLGAEFLFEKIAVRPGKPTWLARLGERLVLGLPGNPASAFVCARLFLRPLLDRMNGGDAAAGLAPRIARTRRALAANGARETYLRARIAGDADGALWAEAAGDQDSSLISVFAAADALIVRAPHAPAAAPGAPMPYLPL